MTKISPQDVANQAGVDLGSGRGPSELDELALDPQAPTGETVLGEGSPDTQLPTEGHVGIAPPIGEGGDGAKAGESSEAYQDSRIGYEIGELLDTDQAEKAIELITKLKTVTGAVMLGSAIEEGLKSYYKSPEREKDLVETLAFESARVKIDAGTDEELKGELSSLVDIGEGSAIRSSSLDFEMKALLAARLRTTSEKNSCLSDICKDIIGDDGASRTQAVCGQILRVLVAFGVQDSGLEHIQNSFLGVGQYGNPNRDSEKLRELIYNQLERSGKQP